MSRKIAPKSEELRQRRRQLQYGVHIVAEGEEDTTIRPARPVVKSKWQATSDVQPDADSHQTDEEMIFGEINRMTDDDADTTIRPHLPPKRRGKGRK